jgi:hypothetical protein
METTTGQFLAKLALNPLNSLDTMWQRKNVIPSRNLVTAVTDMATLNSGLKFIFQEIVLVFSHQA